MRGITLAGKVYWTYSLWTAILFNVDGTDAPAGYLAESFVTVLPAGNIRASSCRIFCHHVAAGNIRARFLGRLYRTDTSLVSKTYKQC